MAKTYHRAWRNGIRMKIEFYRSGKIYSMRYVTDYVAIMTNPDKYWKKFFGMKNLEYEYAKTFAMGGRVCTGTRTNGRPCSNTVAIKQELRFFMPGLDDRCSHHHDDDLVETFTERLRREKPKK